jgi:hypothetical protein
VRPVTWAEFKQECLERFADGGPDASRYGLALAVASLADVLEIGLGTTDPSSRNGLERIAAKLEGAIDAVAEGVHGLADAHF